MFNGEDSGNGPIQGKGRPLPYTGINKVKLDFKRNDIANEEPLVRKFSYLP